MCLFVLQFRVKSSFCFIENSIYIIQRKPFVKFHRVAMYNFITGTFETNTDTHTHTQTQFAPQITIMLESWLSKILLSWFISEGIVVLLHVLHVNIRATRFHSYICYAVGSHVNNESLITWQYEFHHITQQKFPHALQSHRNVNVILGLQNAHSGMRAVA